jgi:hypothetical protein
MERPIMTPAKPTPSTIMMTTPSQPSIAPLSASLSSSLLRL